MIKAIAIDDEPLALKVIESFCNESNEVELQKTFTKPHEAIEYLKENNIDLLFLDINMPSVSGIDVAKMVKDKMIVFTTAYSEFAVEGFDLNAVDYLLKPFTKDRFKQAIQKVKQLKSSIVSEDQSCFYIKADYALHRVDFRDVLYIEGLDDYIKIHLPNRKPIVARSTMKGILELLPSDKFVRIHRSFIVPLARIKAVKGKLVVLPETEFPIGSSYEAAFQEAFNKGS
ncbi:MAG TPA: LytTR family DNA-binding domain-containing protein [Bacteroidia bacterium]|nr:response regulator transcription factor [Bacteroidia bacterium]HRD40257.1 LytTR family DNA-binding domain-containing protein [Bacteroidia bacterium]